MGDFVKYYNGSFSEAGIFGKETPIVTNSWHPRILYSKKYDLYFMSSSHVNVPAERYMVDDIMEIRTGKDLVRWSKPTRFMYNGKEFGNHYVALVADDNKNQPCIIDGDEFSILSNHNGTDVIRHKAYFKEK